MNPWQAKVREFHEKFGVRRDDEPGLPDGYVRDLRKRLINEEADELCDAIDRRDFVGVVDGICDLVYVSLGAAISFGVDDLDPFFEEVHRTNMLKTVGNRDRGGKILKPPGWEPPRIAELLKELREGK